MEVLPPDGVSFPHPDVATVNRAPRPPLCSWGRSTSNLRTTIRLLRSPPLHLPLLWDNTTSPPSFLRRSRRLVQERLPIPSHLRQRYAYPTNCNNLFIPRIRTTLTLTGRAFVSNYFFQVLLLTTKLNQTELIGGSRTTPVQLEVIHEVSSCGDLTSNSCSNLGGNGGVTASSVGEQSSSTINSCSKSTSTQMEETEEKQTNKTPATLITNDDESPESDSLLNDVFPQTQLPSKSQEEERSNSQIKQPRHSSAHSSTTSFKQGPAGISFWPKAKVVLQSLTNVAAIHQQKTG